MKTPDGELLCGLIGGVALLLLYLFFRWLARTPEGVRDGATPPPEADDPRR